MMKQNKKIKYRHEMKFIISEPEREIIAANIGKIMTHDKNAGEGMYFIRSLYFDDWEERAYTEKAAGIASRRKYRLRFYNMDDSFIQLECKRKEGQYINKTSAKLSREEAEQLVNGDYHFLYKRKEQICTDFYVECMTNRMRPKVVVDYEREPFVFPYGDVRVTFDSHVRAGGTGYSMFDAALPTLEVLEPHQLIMEVKFTEYLPNMIKDLIQTPCSIYSAASKYVMCLEKQKEFTNA